jgi:hypothetical protein
MQASESNSSSAHTVADGRCNTRVPLKESFTICQAEAFGQLDESLYIRVLLTPGHLYLVGPGQLGFCSDDFLATGLRSTFRQLVPFNSDKLPTGNDQEVTENFP